jgi:peroxiredoxin
MALTPSTMRELGWTLPDFSLPDTVSRKAVGQEYLQGRIAVVAFICNHCPFVIHMKKALAEFSHDCRKTGVRMIAVSSNDVSSHPMDGPEQMKLDAQTFGYDFPYLYDESQEVARVFDAACTPDFYVFDSGGKLAYRGQFDDSRPGNGRPIDGGDLRSAVQALARGEAPALVQKPSIGCNIKWK